MNYSCHIFPFFDCILEILSKLKARPKDWMIIKQIKYFGGLELEQWLPIQFEVISTPGWIESQGRRPILLIQTRNIKLSKVLSAYYQ